MAATLHDFPRQAIVVMDGRRLVAKAKAPVRRGLPWLLRIYGGCWISPKRYLPNLWWDKLFGHVMHYQTVRTKREAMAIMKGLV